MLSYSVSYKIANKSGWRGIILGSSILYIASIYITGLHWGNVLYFFIGSALRLISTDLKKCLFPSILSVLPILLISVFNATYSRGELSGLGLTLLMMSFLMALSSRVGTLRSLIVWFGKNSLIMVLMSPIFTVLTKQYIHLFTFDPTRILWAFLSTALVVGLCLVSAKIFDKLRISYLMMNRSFYYPYSKD